MGINENGGKLVAVEPLRCHIPVSLEVLLVVGDAPERVIYLGVALMHASGIHRVRDCW